MESYFVPESSVIELTFRVPASSSSISLRVELVQLVHTGLNSLAASLLQARRAVESLFAALGSPRIGIDTPI
jgi:hypothetical protein